MMINYNISTEYVQPSLDTTSVLSLTSFNRVTDNNYGWSRLYESIRKFASLEDDWDGDGAAAPSDYGLSLAVALTYELENKGYPLPDTVSVTPAGSILYCWQKLGCYTEIEIARSGSIEAMYIDSTGEASHSTISSTDYSSGIRDAFVLSR